jgi:DNA (cytosine-5)-methyltransferase 1
MNPLRVITLFSGYDSQCLALNRLGVEYELVRWCEIDKHAIKAHNALFPQWADRNLGDVSKVDWHSVPGPIDLLTYSSPCQDFSQAGLQRGGEKGSGTRSGLLWECERAIEALRPRYLVFENVPALVSEKFMPTFMAWAKVLAGLGYRNYWQCLNAKHYGVPQNRNRVFMVSIHGEGQQYFWPKPFKLERRLKDVLEQEVPESYYLSEDRIQGLLDSTRKEEEEGRGFAFEPKDGSEDYANSVTTNAGGRKTDNFIITMGQLSTSQNSRVINSEGISPAVINGEKDGIPKITECRIASVKSRDKDNPTGVRTANNGNFVQTLEPGPADTSNTISTVAKDNLLLEPARKHHQQDDIQSEDGLSRTLVVGSHGNSSHFTKTAVTTPIGLRIRRLTERELFRLMDVDDTDIDTLLSAGIAKTQLAKMAGNSIVVAVLYHIFNRLLVETQPKRGEQMALF